MSSEVPQADLQPSRLHVYIRWSFSFLGLMYSVMYSSPMAGSPHSFSLSTRLSPMSTLGLDFLMFFTLGAFWGCSSQDERSSTTIYLCLLYLVRNAHDGALEVESLPDVFAPCHMISEGLQWLEIAVADVAEEDSLLCCHLVLVAEVLGNLPEYQVMIICPPLLEIITPESLLEVLEVLSGAMEVWVIRGVAHLREKPWSLNVFVTIQSSPPSHPQSQRRRPRQGSRQSHDVQSSGPLYYLKHLSCKFPLWRLFNINHQICAALNSYIPIHLQNILLKDECF